MADDDQNVEQAINAMRELFADARRPRSDEEARRRVWELLETIEPRVIGEQPVNWLPVVVWASQIAAVALTQEQQAREPEGPA